MGQHDKSADEFEPIPDRRICELGDELFSVEQPEIHVLKDVELLQHPAMSVKVV
jgi:hypothetical protein